MHTLQLLMYQVSKLFHNHCPKAWQDLQLFTLVPTIVPDGPLCLVGGRSVHCICKGPLLAVLIKAETVYGAQRYVDLDQWLCTCCDDEISRFWMLLRSLHALMSGTDAVGAKRLIPEAWRKHKEFDNIHKLDGVAVITVQLRYNGWITEMQDSEKARTTSQVCCCMLFVVSVSLQYQSYPFKYTITVIHTSRHKAAAKVDSCWLQTGCSAPLGLLGGTRHLSTTSSPCMRETGIKCCCLSLQGSSGLDNLLYSADADFSCFADLAVTSPVDYYLEGQGSLMQCVLTPATQYMPMCNKDIAARVHQQARPFHLACHCFVSLRRVSSCIMYYCIVLHAGYSPAPFAPQLIFQQQLQLAPFCYSI